MRVLWRHFKRLVVGCILLVGGVILIPFPIIPGTIFIIGGLLVLSPFLPFMHRVMVWLERKYPALHKAVHQLDKKMARYLD